MLDKYQEVNINSNLKCHALKEYRTKRELINNVILNACQNSWNALPSNVELLRDL